MTSGEVLAEHVEAAVAAPPPVKRPEVIHSVSWGVTGHTLRRCADLAGLEDPNLVAQAVMTNLRLVDQSGEWPTPLGRSQPLRMRELSLAIPVDVHTTSGMVPGHLAVKMLGAFPRQHSPYDPVSPTRSMLTRQSRAVTSRSPAALLAVLGFRLAKNWPLNASTSGADAK